MVPRRLHGDVGRFQVVRTEQCGVLRWDGILELGSVRVYVYVNLLG